VTLQENHPPATPQLREEHLQAYKFFERLHGLFDALRPCASHPNRKLHFDEYALGVLFYFFNPAIASLRGLQIATDFEKVRQSLGIRRMSLGSMSESVRLFDPDLLAGVFEGLVQTASERRVDRRLHGLRQVLTVVDGTILPALPRMAWAVWLGRADRGAKAHVQFEVCKDTPSHIEITAGNASETRRLKASLEPGRLYVMDRGYVDFDLFREIVEADSSFVIRMNSNTVIETLEEIPLTPESEAAGVRSDRIVRMGWKTSRAKFDRPVRLVEVHVRARPPRGLAYPVKKVSSKKGFRRPQGEAYTLRLATDRLDLPADVIALIYQYRWQVELFFRLLKSVLGCRHLLSDSIEGVSIQVYCALIASLLLAEYTGVKPSKRLYELFALYLQGWVKDDELAAALARLSRQDEKRDA
jgi:hypothetical protein